ncbi:MAG TPA: hypothetical protein VF918_12395 [Anaerolineales bacterium]
MNKRNTLTLFLFILIMYFGSSACTSHQLDSPDLTATPPTNIATESRTCKPALDDGVSPSYKPNAPERTIVEQGHVVTGLVLSSVGCKPIVNAKLEFWPEEG